ncbi:MAG TPA: GTP cyclohydrolase I FolE [Rhabdochlamydiaceae bacterium]|jgi:GTP cyclohydrolase I
MIHLDHAQDAAITHHPHPQIVNSLSREEKIAAITEHFSRIMEILGLDLSHASLAKTPERVAHMYIDELFWGLDLDAFPDISYLENDLMENPAGMIVVKDIPIKSICEHHFVPILGSARIAYIPAGKILGLSKINRIVDYFCRRPQLQERLTAQIADALSIVLETEDVAVSIEAEHLCVTFRGIEHPTSRTHSSVLRGKFKKDPLQAAFLAQAPTV